MAPVKYPGPRSNRHPQRGQVAFIPSEDRKTRPSPHSAHLCARMAPTFRLRSSPRLARELKLHPLHRRQASSCIVEQSTSQTSRQTEVALTTGITTERPTSEFDE